MTRRVIAFRLGSEFRVSQEFNGDHQEAALLGSWIATKISVNWNEIVALFDDIEDDDFSAFADKVKECETLYGYTQDPLWLVQSEEALLTESEEVWILQNKKLVLYAKYGDREWPAIKAANEGASWITEDGDFCKNYSRDMLKYANVQGNESTHEHRVQFFRKQAELPGWKQIGFNGCWSCDRSVSCERFQKSLVNQS